jgi:hypothetical protein
MLLSAHIKLTWVDCTPHMRPILFLCMLPELPTDLSVRIVPKALPQASSHALGMTTWSPDSAGAFIFYDRLMEQRTHTKLLPAILGRVLAHELTHLLLPQDGHSDAGLMRGQWSTEDLHMTSSECLGLPPRWVQAMQKEALRRILSTGLLRTDR